MAIIFPSASTAAVINAAVSNFTGSVNNGDGTYTDTALTVNEDLSNIVQVGQTVTNQLTSENFINSVTSMLETVGRIYFETLTTEGVDKDAFNLKVDSTEFALLREKVRIDHTLFEASFVLDENASSTFNDLFGKHPFSFKVKVWGNRGFYRTKPFTISYEMYKTSVQSLNGWNELISRMWGVIDAVVDIALAESPWFLIRQQIANAELYRQTGGHGVRVIELSKRYTAETGNAYSGTTDPAFAKWFVKFQRHLRKVMRIPTRNYCGANVPPINTPERYERKFLIDTFYDDINNGLSGVYHDNKIGNIDDYELIPFIQNVNDPQSMSITPANPPVLTVGSTVTNVSATGIVGAIWDKRGTFYTLDYRKVANQPNTFDDHVNYISTVGASHNVDEDSNIIVFTIDTTSGGNGFTVTETVNDDTND